VATEKGKVVSRARIPVDPGNQSPKTARAWTSEQIVYRNFAGMFEALDTRAVQFVMEKRDHFRARMAAPMRRWAVNWSAANADVMWHEREDDVHIPETKKALEGKVARVVEAVTGFDPVFEAEGVKGDVSRHTAKVIGSYVYRQMEMADWKSLVDPIAKDGELTNSMIVKVRYDRRVEDIIERRDDLAIGKGGKPTFVTERRMRKAVVWQGCTLHQVDPFLFIYDLDASKTQECAYIGDESYVFLHDLEQMAAQGFYSKSQVEKLKMDRGGGSSSDRMDRTNHTDQLRQSRSIALGNDFTREPRGNHGASRIRILEMWAWFDFGEKGFDGVVDPTGERLTGVQRVVITIANDVIIRLQQNPFDRKFVPYAFQLVNRTGHELVATAPFDAVVQSNALFDRMSSNIYRWFDLSVSPLIVTSDTNSDLPDSILDVEAGKVMRNAGSWDWIKVPDITAAVSYQQQYSRREIEELSGNLRVYESPANTATETERKVQEQQRMVRSSIRASGELWRQVAHLVKAIELQFATGPQMFQVVGKNSRLIGRYAEITPQMMMEDVDFRFLGLTDVHVFGNRLNGMSQWMNRWGPLLPTMPKVNMQALCRYDFELSVGRSQVSEIFPDDASPWEAWSQEEENAVLMTGQRVDVHEADNDEEHLQILIEQMDALAREGSPNFVMDAHFDHYQAHEEQLQRKRSEQQRMQSAAQENAALLSYQQGSRPNVDSAPVPGGIGSARGQIDVTPGSPQARTQPRTGRGGSGLSQTQVV